MRHNQVTIGASTIDVWCWSLDVSLDMLPRFVSALSDAEFARAARFVRERDRLRFTVGRGRLREILSNYLDVSPRRLAFDYNAFGKPRLAGRGEPPLYFNLSHSAGMAVLAVSDHYQVGIDVERVVPFKEDLAKYFFSRVERRALRCVPADRYLPAFYRCWTRKEAFVKAHGAGLSIPLDSFDVSVGAMGEPRLLRLEGMPEASAQWRFLNLETETGFVGAVAAATAGNEISIRYRLDETLQDYCEGGPAEPSRLSVSALKHFEPMHRENGSRSALV